MRGKFDDAARSRASMGALLLALVVVPWAGSAADSLPPVADFMRRPDYDLLSLSPDGNHLAARVQLKDRSAIAVLSMQDLSVVNRIGGARDTYIEEFLWVSPKRILMTFSTSVQNDAQRYMLPSLYAVDVDGANKANGQGLVIDPLVGDDRHVLMLGCDGVDRAGCISEVRRVDVARFGRGEVVARSPLRNARFLADHDGEVRWTWATDEDDLQKLYYRADAKAEWIEINDEAVSGLERVPLQFSRDGRSTYLYAESAQGPARIERFDVATRASADVLRHPRVDPGRYILSADGLELVGAYYFDGLPKALFIDPVAPEAKLAGMLAAAFPGTYARVVDYSTDGRKALVLVESDRDPGSYYLFDRDSKKASFLVARMEWLDPERMAPVEPIEFKARDGTVINGLLTRPAKRSKQPPPLVVMPHGGPHFVRDYWGFDAESQMLASRGYAVLRVDFRGSGGYGRAFELAGYGQWGRAMQDDITDATRWAIASGNADARRICLYGTSYGAYAALMGAIREPDLYRCAVGASGVYDLDLLTRWGDTQRHRSGERYLARTLGPDRSLRAQNSPARRAGEIKAALLLAHGGRDDRASPEHYRAMTRALDAAGKTYETYYRSYEGHGLFDEENSIEFAEALLAFLGRHLDAPADAD